MGMQQDYAESGVASRLRRHLKAPPKPCDLLNPDTEVKEGIVWR
jgi:hypothetical protein